ncbi:hypothetical protein L6452_13160 [Arctium lappa]|uniref:Uncharacterized protein n=1 Tax=Arctium lappa TaxID=4217 RepID=A0ACB9CHH9_ARCLA|nr:hypothetical protein L6452_13160 [Arctium lappa]
MMNGFQCASCMLRHINRVMGYACFLCWKVLEIFCPMMIVLGMLSSVILIDLSVGSLLLCLYGFVNCLTRFKCSCFAGLLRVDDATVFGIIIQEVDDSGFQIVTKGVLGKGFQVEKL